MIDFDTQKYSTILHLPLCITLRISSFVKINIFNWPTVTTITIEQRASVMPGLVRPLIIMLFVSPLEQPWKCHYVILVNWFRWKNKKYSIHFHQASDLIWIMLWKYAHMLNGNNSVKCSQIYSRIYNTLLGFYLQFICVYVT